jgi:carbamoyl-phosphate synthase large subunit
MRSTGEVMGIAHDFPTAFAKAEAAAGMQLPESGTVFITVTDGDKPAAAGVAMALHGLGFKIVATSGTAQAIKRMGIPVEPLRKIGEGSPNVLELIERGEVRLVVNTPAGTGARVDGWEIRSAAVASVIPCITTMTGAMAAAQAISAAGRRAPSVISLQELHRAPVAPRPTTPVA